MGRVGKSAVWPRWGKKRRPSPRRATGRVRKRAVWPRWGQNGRPPLPAPGPALPWPTGAGLRTRWGADVAPPRLDSRGTRAAPRGAASERAGPARASGWAGGQASNSVEHSHPSADRSACISRRRPATAPAAKALARRGPTGFERAHGSAESARASATVHGTSSRRGQGSHSSSFYHQPERTPRPPKRVRTHELNDGAQSISL